MFTKSGERKYLNQSERDIFYSKYQILDLKVKSFIGMLFWTGARISEILNLTSSNFDLCEGLVTIECLKKRKRGIYRQVPIPPRIQSSVEDYITASCENEKIWKFSRRTGYRYIKEIMEKANINGPMACPKGLRHSFAIHCLLKKIPITLIKKWLGHSSLSTTMIYVDLMGSEEIEIAQRLWE